MAEKRERQIKLQDTGISKISAVEMGITHHLAGTGVSNRVTRSLQDVTDLIRYTVSEPYTEFAWKFYYPDNDVKAQPSSYASLFNNGGMNTRNKAQARVATLIRDAVEQTGGSFKATYTRVVIDSDNLKKGNFMHVLFVKFVPPSKDETPQRVKPGELGVSKPKSGRYRSTTNIGTNA